MMPPRETLELARRILAYEAVEGRSSEPMESAAILVNEKLRLHLCALVGVAGYQGFLTRALTLAKEEVPSLGAVQITAEGYLQGRSVPESQIDEDHAQGTLSNVSRAILEHEGGVILLAQLLELLFSFVGEALTYRLVQDIAPHLAVTTKLGTSTPFGTILQEVDQLKNLSERLKSLAGQHPVVEEALTSISGNIWNTATLLEILVHVRGESGKSGSPLNDVPEQEDGPYVM